MRARVRPYLPSGVGIAVFCSGVASMGLEILAGRILAPQYGNSIYTWGTIIGVFLAALSIGYWLAGRRAGTHASRGALAWTLVAAAGYVALLIVFADPVLDTVATIGLPHRFAALPPVILLFGPPTILLGFVSPYGAELVEADSVGDASGQIYALGTGGSIVGAFGTTFVLVPAVGIGGIELIFGLILLVAAAAVVPGPMTQLWVGIPLVAIALLVGYGLTAGVASGPQVVYETQTPYQHLQVVDDDGIRTLYLDGGPQSAMDLDDPDRYVFEYSKYLHLPLLVADTTDDVDRVLFIGGGGFSSPKRFVRNYDNVTVDVVELDPDVVSAATAYFRVNESDRMRIHTMDGRVFLQETNRTYDAIVLDAFRSTQVPYHLTTVEFFQLARNRLSSNGTLVANIISSTTGGDSAFYRAAYRTLDRVFPQVYSFPTSETSALQNIELVATKRIDRLSTQQWYARNGNRSIGVDLSAPISRLQHTVTVGEAPLLTDDHAPVDSLVASQVDTRYVVDRTNQSTQPAIGAPG